MMTLPRVLTDVVSSEAVWRQYTGRPDGPDARELEEDWKEEWEEYRARQPKSEAELVMCLVFRCTAREVEDR